MSSHYVYVIVNKINLKLYFGSHSWEGTGADKNYYGSGKIIKQAIEKYGKDNFQVEVLYYYDNVEECRKDEERILTEYNVKDCPHSYNLKNSAIGMTSEDMTDEIRKNLSQIHKGKTLSENTKRKMSESKKGLKRSENTKRKIAESLKGRKLSEEHRKNLLQSKKNVMTPIVVIDKNGKVKIFKSQKECSRVLEVNLGNINDCLKGRHKTCKGYIIKHLKRCITDYKITKRKAKKTEKIKLTTKRKGTTPIVAIQKDTGRVRMFLSQLECSRVLGANSGSINNCLKGIRKSTGGYTFKKINRDKRVFTVSQRSKADLNRLRGIA